MGVLTEGPHREIYLMVKGSTMLKAGRMVWKSKALFLLFRLLHFLCSGLPLKVMKNSTIKAREKVYYVSSY